MELVLNFIMSVVAGVVSDCVCDFLNGRRRGQ